MPLIHSSSNKARSANIATEINAGKDPKQAAAIGYAEQRRAKAAKDEAERIKSQKAALDAAIAKGCGK